MGKRYANRSEFQALFEKLFDRLQRDDPRGLDELVEQEMVIRFRVRDPDVELWVDGRSSPVQTSFDPGQLAATLTVELTADVMHDLLLQTLPLGKAVLFRKVKVQGSKSKAMRLEGLLHAMQTAYPELVDELDEE